MLDVDEPGDLMLHLLLGATAVVGDPQLHGDLTAHSVRDAQERHGLPAAAMTERDEAAERVRAVAEHDEDGGGRVGHRGSPPDRAVPDAQQAPMTEPVTGPASKRRC